MPVANLFLQPDVHVYLGVDPGMSGGLALVDAECRPLWYEPMPETDRDVLDLLEEAAKCRAHAVLERVHAMPKQGVSSTFKFGMNYGALRMALTAMRMPFTEAIPQRWQKSMGCLTRGDKNVSKARAQQLFPHTKVTHAVADALLLAAYCHGTMRGLLSVPPAT